MSDISLAVEKIEQLENRLRAKDAEIARLKEEVEAYKIAHEEAEYKAREFGEALAKAEGRIQKAIEYIDKRWGNYDLTNKIKQILKGDR